MVNVSSALRRDDAGRFIFFHFFCQKILSNVTYLLTLQCRKTKKSSLTL